MFARLIAGLYLLMIFQPYHVLLQVLLTFYLVSGQLVQIPDPDLFQVQTFHRCFLPNFSSFGIAVSEEIFLEINQSETRMASGSHVC
jgi:hypothetical protein